MLPSCHPGEEIEHVLVLLRHGHLRLDEVEEKGGGHDGAAVDHGVVGLAVVVQDDLIEVPAAGLPPNVVLDDVCTKLVQVDGICEGLTER